jgi:hypothetical protein
LHRQGLSNEEIVKTTGRSYPSVCRVVKRGCVQQSKTVNWTKEEVDNLCKLIQRGLTNREISRLIGRSENAVQTKRRDLDIWVYRPLVRGETARVSDALFYKVSSMLKIGSRYMVRFLRRSKNVDAQWPRPLIFEGIQYNWRRDPFFMFRSEAGFRESFTIQQLVDIEFDEVKEEIAL